MTCPANVLPALAAWLHIGPDDSESTGMGDHAPIGVQRLHVADVPEKLRSNAFSLSLLPSHLATDIVNVLSQVTGADWFAEHGTILAALETGSNFRVSLGGGMFATVCPAEPTSGLNLSRAEPTDITTLVVRAAS